MSVPCIPNNYRPPNQIQSMIEAEAYFKYFVHGGNWERFPPNQFPVTVGVYEGQHGPIAKILSCAEYFGSSCRVYLLFKRDTFHKFSDYFPHEPNGHGQTLNIELLRKAAAEHALIAIVNRDRTIHWMPAAQWHDYVSTHNTIRRPSTETGYEGSVPLKILRQLEPAP